MRYPPALPGHHGQAGGRPSTSRTPGRVRGAVRPEGSGASSDFGDLFAGDATQFCQGATRVAALATPCGQTAPDGERGGVVGAENVLAPVTASIRAASVGNPPDSADGEPFRS
ncbi:hypothetical protein GCM10018980_01880 [Streptomyces capoamus]|uniref:Uncharacterized protein n=1 Tax=Streptomyces capoamus TaxID=68183 RepID=A0A919BYI8_9ACTN|nr:hypothetical protein GCM10010501_09890 [Streptomyces libani subsp. rufus]GHG33295.1 hypothetical protein GCM10018980_01880 [Streptomyces capoamus]